MKEYDKIFNSNQNMAFKNIQLANGYISQTTILFELEGIAVAIEANGNIQFFDNKENLLVSFSIPNQTGGKEVYTEVLCGVEDKVIVMKFPIVKWVDNYPHCDGEHDRWDAITIGYHVLNYNLLTNEVTLV